MDKTFASHPQTPDRIEASQKGNRNHSAGATRVHRHYVGIRQSPQAQAAQPDLILEFCE